MSQSKEQLIGEIRYAQRLCQRTARLYRRAQTTFTFLSAVAGSAAIVSVSSQLPASFAMTSAFVFAVISAVNLSMRPADRVAQNDSDVKKYAALIAKSTDLEAPAIAKLLAEARQTDATEVEPLRNVAYNDVMMEINRADQLIPLNRSEKFLAAIA